MLLASPDSLSHAVSAAYSLLSLKFSFIAFTHNISLASMLGDEDPGIPGTDPRSSPPRVLGTQLALASALGFSALVSFSFLRYKWPKLYSARNARRNGLPPLPNNLLGWMWSLYQISEEQILEHAGLDAFVFLGFFKMAIKLLSTCTLFGVFVISPIRWWFTGNYDQDDGDYVSKISNAIMVQSLRLTRRLVMDEETGMGMSFEKKKPKNDDEYNRFFWLYVIFTYLFTFIAMSYLMHQTLKVIRVRQYYLGSQNSITDRTILFSGISKDLRNEQALKTHVESLGIGTVQSVSLCYNWHQLDNLFDKRKEILTKLERAWSEYLGPTWTEGLKGSDNPEDGPLSLPLYTDRPENGLLRNTPSSIGSPIGDSSDDINFLSSRNRTAALQLGASMRLFKRPAERVGLFGLFGPKIDIIDKYTYQLEVLDDQIRKIRAQNNFVPLETAFVTMNSVAAAQMTAQAVLDPRPNTLIARTAPAPHDVIWRNLYMSPSESLMRTYVVTLVVAVLSMAMVFSVSYYLARFLTLETIQKYWPQLAKLLEKSQWAVTFVTGILPPLLYTMFNAVLPYFYLYLSGLQGYVSSGEVELSAISKNFFYVFFYMFLFTVAGTASNYWSYLKDTTKFAMTLARSLQDFSAFYIDLIILQGIGMYPFRLLQMGSILKWPWTAARCKSPRDYRDLYKPPIINYGIHLPQPILILIVVMLYSVISSKIMAAGTFYFILGYFVYKYQLMYSMVHPQHSTGRAWPLIFRRVCLGLVLFHLTMAGILALQSAYFLAATLTPLPISTLLVWYNFEDAIVPLLGFIALRSIRTTGSERRNDIDFSFVDDDAENDESHNGDDTFLTAQGEDEQTPLQRRRYSHTIDEQREKNLRYINPNLIRPLDGPWIGIEGDDVILANPEGTVKCHMRFEEWE